MWIARPERYAGPVESSARAMGRVSHDDGDAMNARLDVGERVHRVTHEMDHPGIVEWNRFSEGRQVAVQKDVVVVSRGTFFLHGSPDDRHGSTGDDLPSARGHDVESRGRLAVRSEHCQHHDEQDRARNTMRSRV